MATEMEVDLEEDVGDSSRNVLASYQKCARELLKSALLKQRGGKLFSETVAPTELKRRKERLQCKQIEAAVELELRRQLSVEPLGSVSVSEDEAYVDAVRIRLDSLERELLAVKSDYVRNCRLLECLRQGCVLKEKVFSGSSNNIRRALDKTVSDEDCKIVGGSFTDNDTTRQLLKQSELNGELLSELEKIKSIRSELLSVMKERSALQQQSRELMKTVQDTQSLAPSDSIADEADNDSEDVRVRRQLHRARNELCLLRGTFQGLIAGSGVPWNAADTHLLEVTLNLGDDEQWK